VELHVDKRIRYRHGRNDHDVHEDGENNNLSVEANQSVVFGEPVGNEVESDGTQKEPVESKVDNQVEGLFDSIPIRVNIAVLLTNLQTRWNPNIKNGNVDDCNENSRTDHDGTGSSSVGYDDANSVDDDLKQQLNLDAPKEED